MFQSCSSLTSLNLSNFNTNNVQDMSFMFNKCSSLTSLNLSNFNTNNVQDMSYMFNQCSSLTSLNLSNFKTDKTGSDIDNIFKKINKNCKLVCDDSKLNKEFIDSINHK